MMAFLFTCHQFIEKLVPNIKKPTEQQKTTGKEENEVQAIKEVLMKIGYNFPGIEQKLPLPM